MSAENTIKLQLASGETKPFTVVIAGGGTGGHLIPGVALAQEFERLLPEGRVVFLIPGTSLERSILDSHRMRYVTCGGDKLRGGVVGKVKGALSLWRAFRKSKGVLKDLNPNIVFGVGGYGSVCGGVAARRLGVPVHLLEQNVVAGRVNRLLSRVAETLYAQWELAKALPGKAKVEVVGNPIRRNIGRYGRTTANRLLDLDPAKKTLLVMGGSQGARAINNFITENLLRLEKYQNKVQIIHLTGNAEYPSVRNAWAHSRIRHRVMPFASDMGPLLCAADVVLCRAGATTLAELTALSKPMVLVPLPSSADNHQYLNAKYLADKGAAVVLKQEKLARPMAINALLDEIVLDDSRRQTMADCASLIGAPRAGKRIALSVLSRFGVEVADESTDEVRSQRISGRAA